MIAMESAPAVLLDCNVLECFMELGRNQTLPDVL